MVDLLKLNELHQRALELGFHVTKEDLVQTLTQSEKLYCIDSRLKELHNIPFSVIERIKKERANNLDTQLLDIEKLEKIQIIKHIGEEPDLLIIGERTLMIFEPNVNGYSVFSHPKSNSDTRYINGLSLPKLLLDEEVIMPIQESVEDFLNILELIPGGSKSNKILNFVELIGLQETGSRTEGGTRSNVGVTGYVWLSLPTEYATPYKGNILQSHYLRFSRTPQKEGGRIQERMSDGSSFPAIVMRKQKISSE